MKIISPHENKEKSMDKQQIAHILEKEIAMIDINIRRLDRIYMQTIDSHQARDIYDTMQDLDKIKKDLEKVIENIVEDAKVYSTNFNR